MLTQTLAASAPPTPSSAKVIAEALYYLGLSAGAGIGLVCAYLTRSESEGGVLIRSAFRLGRPVAVFVAITAALHFLNAAAKTAKTDIAGALAPSVVGSFVTAPPRRGSWASDGQVALLQLGVYLVLVLALMAMSRRESRAAARAVVVLALVAGLVPEMPFGALDVNGVAKEVLTSVHIAGALAWVGGLTVLAVLGLVTRTSNGPVQARLSDDWSTIWTRYSLVALVSVGLIVVSGTWLAWVHVSSPTQLWTTPYGRYLAVKLVLVLAMMAIGGYNARVLLPKIHRARETGDRASMSRIATRHFSKVVALEAVLAVAVLFVVPFLGGSARAQAGAPSARSFDLTVFGTGAVLVALVTVGLWAGTRRPRRTPEPSTS